MEFTTTIIVLSIVIAILFDVINGFHDAANSIATVVSTRVLSPRVAVLWAAFFNFVAMFFFTPKVADTISKMVKIEPSDHVFVYVVMCGLLGAIIWNLITWYLGLPTSSSHALIGGLSGAALTYKGTEVLRTDKLYSIIGYIPLAPIIGLVIGFGIMLSLFWIFRNWRPSSIDGLFRKGQLVSAALYSLGHGGNDAQKTMGVILALLIAGGIVSPDTTVSLMNLKTLWIILVCHLAMAVGTAFGGWRIVKTVGMKITKLKPIGGFSAETAGAITLFAATHAGIPVSTTHTITGSIIGVGMITKFSAIKWGVASRIVWAWFFTIPAAGLIAAGCFKLIQLFL